MKVEYIVIGSLSKIRFNLIENLRKGEHRVNFSSKREETIAEISNLTMKDNKRLIFLRTDQNLDTRFQ